MTRPSNVDDQLPIDEVERHPMWAEPEGAYGSHPVHDLRVMIARHLVRFDGRPDSEQALAFFRAVYDLSHQWEDHGTAWLIGQIINKRYLTTQALNAMAVANLTNRQMQYRCNRDVKAIEGLSETFVNAIVKYV